MRLSPPIAAALLFAAAMARGGRAADLQPRSLVKEAVKPLKVVHRDDGVYFVDFGADSFAQIELELPQDAVGPITARLGETLTDGQHLQDKPTGSIRFLQTTMKKVAGAANPVYQAALTRNDARMMPQDVGPVMPFRYAELTGLPAGITPEALRAGALRQVMVHYAFDDAAADFACSDAKLNAIWDLCKHTMKATSYAGLFVDGDRERKPYEADAFINQLGWYYTTSDLSLPRITGDYLISHPTWPTEWIMFSDLIAWNDYLYSGDAASLRTHYGDLKAKTLRALERNDGLISTVQPPVPGSVNNAIHFTGTLKDIVDWPEAERDGYKMVAVNTVVNAFHCRSLGLMAAMADAAGQPAEAADLRAAAAKTLASLNAKLFDAQTGLYLDGEGAAHSALLANVFPLAFGLVPAERREKVTAFVQSRGMACSVYGAQFLMDALFANGRGADAVKLMTAPGDRSWRHMVEDVGTTLTLEAWDNKYKPNQDWNHGWGAAPANLLPRYVLGVEPLEPGYAKALIWPRAGADVTWAHGKVPTAKGPVVIDWKRTALGFTLTADMPAGMEAQVRLPDTWGAEVLVDGKPVNGRIHDRAIEVVASAGKHEFKVGQ